jgi:hypothetical protein
MLSRNALLFALLPLLLASPGTFAQTDAPATDAIRVSVTINEDGSRTSYQFDPANHKAVATTTERDGKPRGKIDYTLDAAGRFDTGRIFGADGKFLFSAVYKYDPAGRLREEGRFDKVSQPIGKIVYDYDTAGKQTGYAILDKNGKVIARTSSPTPTPRSRTH